MVTDERATAVEALVQANGGCGQAAELVAGMFTQGGYEHPPLDITAVAIMSDGGDVFVALTIRASNPPIPSNPSATASPSPNHGPSPGPSPNPSPSYPGFSPGANPSPSPSPYSQAETQGSRENNHQNDVDIKHGIRSAIGTITGSAVGSTIGPGTGSITGSETVFGSTKSPPPRSLTDQGCYGGKRILIASHPEALPILEKVFVVVPRKEPLVEGTPDTPSDSPWGMGLTPGSIR